MTIWLSLLVCVIGLVVYLIDNGKASKLGMISFGVGLFVFLLQSSPEVIRLFGK